MADTRDYGDRWFTGMCKWFNRQSGWGFVVLTSSAGDYTGDEIFVHYNALKVPTNNDGSPSVFRYLSTGEYVRLQIGKTNNTDRPWQASMVEGVDGGVLLCQTKDSEQSSRMNNSTVAKDDLYRVSVAGKMNNPRPRGSGPRDRSSGRNQEKQQTPNLSKGWFVAE
jgi:cold shock CspA family protein|tara:strand:+ start:4583 stop:5080 length:498 start_codon:yes stop_codon:yes gene_type:complete